MPILGVLLVKNNNTRNQRTRGAQKKNNKTYTNKRERRAYFLCMYPSVSVSCAFLSFLSSSACLHFYLAFVPLSFVLCPFVLCPFVPSSLCPFSLHLPLPSLLLPPITHINSTYFFPCLSADPLSIFFFLTYSTLPLSLAFCTFCSLSQSHS